MKSFSRRFKQNSLNVIIVLLLPNLLFFEDLVLVLPKGVNCQAAGVKLQSGIPSKKTSQYYKFKIKGRHIPSFNSHCIVSEMKLSVIALQWSADQFMWCFCQPLCPGIQIGQDQILDQGSWYQSFSCQLFS